VQLGHNAGDRYSHGDGADTTGYIRRPNARCGVVGVSSFLKMMSSIARISTVIGPLRPSASS